MPVLAKLSKTCYDRLGHDVVAEMVDWLNQVDAAHRPATHGLNELNFARLDAKLEQRLAEYDSRLTHRLSMFESRLTAAMAALEFRIDRRMGDITLMMIGLWVLVILAAAAIWFKR